MSRFKKASVKVFSVILCISLLVIAFGCAPKTSSTGSSTIRIGFSAPLTGSYAQAGQDMVNGAQLAINEINAAGGVLGKKMELVAEDDGGDPTMAVQAANKIVSQNVDAAMGYYSSGACNPCLPILNKAGLPVILCAVAATILTHQGYTNVVRIQGYNAQQGKTMAEFIGSQLKAKRVAVIQDGTASPREQADVATTELKKIDPNIQLLSDQITPGEKDFSSTVTKIKGFNPDAVLFTGFYAEGSLLVKQLRGQGVTVQFVAGDGDGDPAFIKVAGADAEGVVMTSPPMTNSIPAAADFIQKYTKKFNAAPGAYSVYCYDAVNLLADALKRANTTDKAAVITALRGTTDLKAITGSISFDQNGDLTHSGYTLIQIKNGQFVPYKG